MTRSVGGVVVRRLGAEDWSVWRDVRLAALRDSPEAFGSTRGRELGFTEATWRGRLGDPRGVAVLATCDGEPVGIGAGHPDVPGWLQVVSMWVAPALRGRGVGSLVLGAVRAHADDQALRLHLDVALAIGSARRLYERHGFVATGETRPIRDGSPELVERMVLPDPSDPGGLGCAEAR